MLRFRNSSIEIKTPQEIEAMRVVGRMAGETLSLVGGILKAGMTTEEINTFVHEDTIRGALFPLP
jgi:methionyl aminopeptidase